MDSERELSQSLTLLAHLFLSLLSIEPSAKT